MISGKKLAKHHHMPEDHIFGWKSGDIDELDNLSENYKTLVGNDFEHKVKFRIGY